MYDYDYDENWEDYDWGEYDDNREDYDWGEYDME